MIQENEEKTDCQVSVKNQNTVPAWGAAKEKIMSEEMENVEEVSLEEALQMEIIFNQALMDVLVAKGVITEQEVLDRVEEVRRETGFELS